ETANGLAMDLQRHLQDEPVLARPPTAGYRLKKFVRKHRVGVAAAAGFVLLLTGATVLSTALALWANREKTKEVEAQQKESAERVRAVGAEQKAKKQAEETQAVLGFLRDKVLVAARPEGEEGGLGIKTTIHEALDAAEPQIQQLFAGYPTTEAYVR